MSIAITDLPTKAELRKLTDAKIEEMRRANGKHGAAFDYQLREVLNAEVHRRQQINRRSGRSNEVFRGRARRQIDQDNAANALPTKRTDLAKIAPRLREQTIYLANVAWSKSNRIHLALIFVGFKAPLGTGWVVYQRTYEAPLDFDKLYHCEIIRPTATTQQRGKDK